VINVERPLIQVSKDLPLLKYWAAEGRTDQS